jgi:hypothetical protein
MHRMSNLVNFLVRRFVSFFFFRNSLIVPNSYQLVSPTRVGVLIIIIIIGQSLKCNVGRDHKCTVRAVQNMCHWFNSQVLRSRQNVTADSSGWRRLTGRLFQTVGPAMANARVQRTVHVRWTYTSCFPVRIWTVKIWTDKITLTLTPSPNPH